MANKNLKIFLETLSATIIVSFAIVFIAVIIFLFKNSDTPDSKKLWLENHRLNLQSCVDAFGENPCNVTWNKSGGYYEKNGLDYERYYGK